MKAKERIKGVIEKKMMDIIHSSELCRIANKDTHWRIRRARKRDLADAILEILPELVEVDKERLEIDLKLLGCECWNTGVFEVLKFFKTPKELSKAIASKSIIKPKS